jgi:hypothetical protein
MLLRANRGPAANVTVGVETVTPAMAAEWLATMPSNRTLNEKSLRKLTSEIDGGLWRLNGEAIIIDAAGALRDGQHRCEAVVRTGKTIQSVVARGVDANFISTIDSGRSRTAGDFLAIQGVTHYNHVAAAINALAFYKVQSYAGLGVKSKGTNMRSFRQGVSLTPQQIAIALDHNPGLMESVTRMVGHPHIKKFPVTAVATIHYLAHDVGQQRHDADKWMDSMLLGTDMPGDSPVLMVRNALIGGRIKTAGRQLYQLARSYNWMVDNRTVTKLPAIMNPVAVVGAEPTLVHID